MVKPLVEQTTEKLKQYILNDQFEIGDRLPNEYELAKVLEVGRSTIRESVRSLVAQNILEVRQGSGTYISSKKGVAEDPLGFSLVKDQNKLVTDLFELRYLLEPRIAERAAQFASEEDIIKLEKIVEEIEYDVEHQGGAYLSLDVQFHSLIAQMSGNIAMENLLPIINESIHLVNESYTSHQMKKESLEAHRSILNAIKARHPIGAYDSMLSHILTVRNSLFGVWKIHGMDWHGLPKK